MEEAIVKSEVNVLAISDKTLKSQRGEVRRKISVQKNPQVTTGQNYKLTKSVVCLGIQRPDNDPEDTDVPETYLFIEQKEELDQLIRALQEIRGEIWGISPKL
jgi:hypothetical protein